jgi:epoxyqueuosine reductase
VRISQFDDLIEHIGMWLAQPAILQRLRVLPSLPGWFRRRYEPRYGPWPPVNVNLPLLLRSVAGIRRDSAAEARAYSEAPLHDLRVQHSWLAGYTLQHMWRVSLGVSPRLQRASRRSSATTSATPSRTTQTDDPLILTQSLRAKAAELGLSAIGIAEYDEKYTFVEHREICSARGNRVIVCALEQNHASTQTIPSALAEKGALSASAAVLDKAAQLAESLHELGFRAAAEPLGGRGIFLHYAVAAGLGQLGLNGQVLTPFAGSRCRWTLIQTDAPLVIDKPVDIGIPKLCDACQVCVRRCPVGAIPAKRAMYRGIEKAKINTVRCWPVVAQAHGCAICMKVCPVQKYGLQPVIDEWSRSGKILGKDSDELEGFTWIDGKHFGPGQRPKLSLSFTKPADFPLVLDKETKQLASEVPADC